MKRVFFLPLFCCATLFAQTGVINTVVGTGQIGYQGSNGDGGPALAAKMDYPGGVTCDNRGNYYLEDAGYIRIIDPSGIINTIPGMNSTYVSCDKAGSLYYGNLYKKDTLGNVTHIAGGGSSLGDGGPALQAQLQQVSSVAFDNAGNIFVCDVNDNRIRKINSAGIITTYAGTGVAGYSGDGGQANQAQLNHPYKVVLNAGGELFIADAYNNVIRKVSAAGIITTVAGTGFGAGGSPGSGGFSGDGGLAINAKLNFPDGLALNPSGELTIADAFNGRVRIVDQNGIITTLAGACTGSSLGDGGPAYNSCLSNPNSIDYDPAGNLFICDYGHARVREVLLGTSNAVGEITAPAAVKFNNPVAEKLVVSNLRPQLLRIFNCLGEEIYSASCATGVTEIDFSSREQGFYFLIAGNTTYKLIKQ